MYAPKITYKTKELINQIMMITKCSIQEREHIPQIVQVACYYYQFTLLPNPFKNCNLLNTQLSKYKIEDVQNFTQIWGLTDIFHLQQLQDESINKMFQYLEFVNNQINQYLNNQQLEKLRIDQRALLCVIYRLCGKDNFTNIFKANYITLYHKYFELIFFDLFLKVVENVFKDINKNISVYQYEILYKQPSIPVELDYMLSRLFKNLYMPSPFMFLVSILQCLNCFTIFEAAEKMNKIQKIDKMGIILTQRWMFNILDHGILLRFTQYDTSSLINPQAKHKTSSSKQMKSKKRSPGVFDMGKNDRFDDESKFQQNLLVRKGYIIKDLDDNGHIFTKFTADYYKLQNNEIFTQNQKNIHNLQDVLKQNAQHEKYDDSIQYEYQNNYITSQNQVNISILEIQPQ